MDIRLVAQTVAQDITVTTKTLQLANSAFLGARSQFKNIDQAVIFLGVDTVRNLAISVTVHEVFAKNSKPKGFNCEQFWYHSLLTALLSKTIAQKSGYDDPGAAYLTGLLHDTGKYLLCQYLGEQYQKLLTEYSHHELVVAEKEHFDCSHPDVGKWLLDSWNLSEELGIAVRDHHSIAREETETSVLGRILRLANTLALKQNIADEQTIKDASILCIAPTALPAIVEEQVATLEDLAGSLGIKIEEPEQAPTSPQVDQENQEQLKNKIAIRSQLYGFMDNIIQAKTVNRVFLTLEETLSLLFNCNDLVLLLPEPAGTTFTFHGSFRNNIAKQLKTTGVVVTSDTCLIDENGSSASINELNRVTVITPPEKESVLAPLVNAFNNDSILAVPVRISPESQGLLFISLTSENKLIAQKEETLQLISSHVGNRLYQETLKEEYASNFAQERITAIEEMARSIAHEISNPLGVIQNYITLLAQKAGIDTQVNQELSIINNEIERIANISNQLGDLSLVSEESANIYIDINKLLTDTVTLYQQSLAANVNISIEYTPVPHLPALWAEENPLKQILGNLITNSVESLEKNGTIEILCRHIPESKSQEVGEIVIVVSDNGVGVPPSIANTIFRAGTTTKGNGHAGLGLAIVSKLTKDLSGRIAHSSGQQGSTQFTLHLPLLKPIP
ncbi:hypothetical protein LA52FAK_23040 [Desulforhopalus sp. 52FAK]